MKQILATLTVLLFIFTSNAMAQLFQQDFTSALTAGNLGGGTTVSNSSVTSDPVYVGDPASNSQFTFLSTNNDLASITISGDGVMRLTRGGSGTIYIVRNTNFTGAPSAAMVSFDFNAETTSGTSGQAIEFMLGQNFANSNNNPAGTDKHSVFFVNTKNPTGTPGTWGITPVNASSTSAYTTTEKITWVVNNSGGSIDYTGPDAGSYSVADDTYDLWVGDSLYYDDQAANSGTADLNNFEMRSAGGNGTYTIDNLLITEVTSGGGSEITNHFRTKQSGDWNVPATWETSPDGTAWTDATLTPFDTSNTITIRNSDTVTVTASVSIDQAAIEDGGAVVVIGDSIVLTITNGLDPVDLQVNGTLKVTGTAIASPGPYSISLNTDAGISFGNGGLYEHNQNGGSIPVSTWETGSTLYVNAVTNSMPGNRNQSFYNIVWDCPGQVGNYNMGFDEVTIGGDITLNNTGTGRWYLCGPVSQDTAVVSVNGNITLVEGQFAAHGTGNAETVIIVNVYGNVTALSGNFSVARGSQGSGTGTTDFYLHGENFILTNVTTQNSNPIGAKFIFTGAAPQNLVFTDVTFGGGGCPVEVESGSTLNVGTSQFGGSGDFILNASATLGSGNAGGLDSTFQNTGALTLSTDAGYTFNGTAAQVTGALLPDTVNNLTVNNPAGVTLSGDVLVNGNLNIVNGDLNLNGNTVTLGTSAVLNETAGNTVTGTTGKLVTTRDLNAPSGVNVGGLGAMISSSANLGSTLVERYHFAGMGLGNEGIFRHFNIEPANNTGLNATLRFYYDESELNSIPEANLTMFKSPTGANNTWNGVGGTVNVTDNYVELSGISDFSYWTLGDLNNPLPVELTSFAASTDGRFVSLSWVTASEINNQGWDVERRIAIGENSFSNWTKEGFVKGSGNTVEQISYSYSDKNITSGVFQYRLKQIDFDGTFNYSSIVEVDVNGPSEFALFQNYPNPFNPETVIRFEVPVTSFVNLKVYNAVGQEVVTLINQQMEKGVYLWNFDAGNLPSGIYIYRLNAGDQVFTKKMMLIK